MDSYKIEQDSDRLPALGRYADAPKKGRGLKALLVIGGTAFATAAVLIVAAGIYWQSLRSSPQYSLALIVEAGRQNNQDEMDRLVDIDAVVDDFLPQITSKSVELYGKGISPQTIERIARIAQPLMPALKDRARAELPAVIRKKTSELEDVPFSLLVLGANRYLKIDETGDVAQITDLDQRRDFKITMHRSGSRWKIVAVEDSKLASDIAQRVGEEIIAIATKGTESAEAPGMVRDINQLMNDVEKLLH